MCVLPPSHIRRRREREKEDREYGLINEEGNRDNDYDNDEDSQVDEELSALKVKVEGLVGKDLAEKFLKGRLKIR